MPAFTHLRTFVNALKSGKSHICECLDAFFHDPAAVQANPHYAAFDAGSWSDGPPDWLGGLLDSIGLTAEERDHVLRWPAAELEKTRAAAAEAVRAGRAPTFFWGIYDGATPAARKRTGADGHPEVVFESPAAALRLTQVNYGEIYVDEV